MNTRSALFVWLVNKILFCLQNLEVSYLFASSSSTQTKITTNLLAQMFCLVMTFETRCHTIWVHLQFSTNTPQPYLGMSGESLNYV